MLLTCCAIRNLQREQRQRFPLLRADASMARQPAFRVSPARVGDELDDPAGIRVCQRPLHSGSALTSELVSDAAADEPWINMGAARNGNRIV